MAIVTAFDQFETLIRENLGTSVMDLRLDELDDPSFEFINSATPLGMGGKYDGTLDLYEARRKVRLSRGGMVTGGTYSGNTVANAGANSDLPTGQSADALAPDPTLVPLTQYVTLATNLKRMLGNVTVNMQQLLADLMADEIEQVAIGHISDAVYHVRKNTLNGFYSDGTGKIGTSSSADDITTAAGGIGVTFSDAPYNRFTKGQRYDVYDADFDPLNSTPAGTEQSPTNGVICVNIDDTNKTVYFESTSGTITVSVGSVFTLHDTVNTAASSNKLSVKGVPKGIEYMFKTSGEFFGLSDITDYSEFLSYVEGNESATVEPEPDLIAKLVNRIAKSGTKPPSILISESALSTQYAYTEKAGYATYVVPSFLAGPNGGVGTPVFQHGTLVMPWLTSEFIRPGMIWGAAPETLFKYQPSGSDTVRWWNGNGSGNGVDKIFVPVVSGSQQTELWQAPFETHIEFMVTEPKRSFRRIGLVTQETA